MHLQKIFVQTAAGAREHVLLKGGKLGPWVIPISPLNHQRLHRQNSLLDEEPSHDAMLFRRIRREPRLKHLLYRHQFLTIGTCFALGLALWPQDIWRLAYLAAGCCFLLGLSWALSYGLEKHTARLAVQYHALLESRFIVAYHAIPGFMGNPPVFPGEPGWEQEGAIFVCSAQPEKDGDIRHLQSVS